MGEGAVEEWSWTGDDQVEDVAPGGKPRRRCGGRNASTFPPQAESDDETTPPWVGDAGV